jgi:hypothetical protein
MCLTEGDVHARPFHCVGDDIEVRQLSLDAFDTGPLPQHSELAWVASQCHELVARTKEAKGNRRPDKPGRARDEDPRAVS